MIFRTEHPKPQFMRGGYINLNGVWEYERDRSQSGKERGLYLSSAVYGDRINVPFCQESALSGIKDTDFINSVWYRRGFTLDKEATGGCVVLHFGAVDYRATVYINGKPCGEHKGGYTSFSFDITQYVNEGENTVVVHAEDDTRSPFVPSGKQSGRYASYGCYYTRTTGIWQTVWLELMPKTHIKSVKYYADTENAVLTIHAELCGAGVLCAEAFWNGKSVGKVTASLDGGFACISLPLAEKHLWQVGSGGLYDLVLTYGEDRVQSYFGLRSVSLDGYRFLINGECVFQRLVLDQGFYPDGIYTAPSDAELEADIDRAIALGFNGARLHQKVFEERFLYHCDRKGYIVWGEYPNWGLDTSSPEAVYSILPEWLEEVDRDFNHPAVIGWCPFNETWDIAGRKQHDGVVEAVYRATKAADTTRPCIDTSGNYHVVTDIFDVHDYEQNPEKLAATYADLPKDGTFYDKFGKRQNYTVGQPIFVSEYGGIRWAKDRTGWGYGAAPQSEEEFLARLKGLTSALLDNECMLGFCYTQLTDVEQEQNGLYTYDRKPKFEPEVIKEILSAPAAIEKGAGA